MDMENSGHTSVNLVEIVFYALEIQVEKEIQRALKKILLHYGKIDLFHSVYSVLFESIVNSIKAIGKRVYFLENNLNINNPADYKKGVLSYKEELMNNRLNYYTARGENYGLNTSVNFFYMEDGMKIEVISNCSMHEEENKRIRQKFKEGMKYHTLISYYDANADQTEGEGLGLVLSTLVLRNMGMNPSDFRIGEKNGSIRTRIEIPFTDTYISERSAYEKLKLREAG